VGKSNKDVIINEVSARVLIRRDVESGIEYTVNYTSDTSALPKAPRTFVVGGDRPIKVGSRITIMLKEDGDRVTIDGYSVNPRDYEK